MRSEYTSKVMFTSSQGCRQKNIWGAFGFGGSIDIEHILTILGFYNRDRYNIRLMQKTPADTIATEITK